MFVSGKSCSKASLANCAHTDCWKWARTVMWYLVHSDWNESEWGFLRRCRSHGVTCAVFTLRGFWDMWKMDFSPPPTSNRQTDIYVPLLDRRSQISPTMIRDPTEMTQKKYKYTLQSEIGITFLLELFFWMDGEKFKWALLN